MRRTVGTTLLVGAIVGFASPALADPTVTRLAGENRYATAVAISQYAYKDDVYGVTVASGADFPDALAAGALADSREGPLLLAPKDGALPPAIKAELARLSPWTIYISGGVKAVSSVVESQLDDYADSVYRLSGADRYETSAEVASWSGQNDTTVFLATGVSFPDALGGGAAAGRLNGALMLTRPGDLPGSVADELEWSSPGKVVVLGGPNAVGDTVIRKVRSVLPTAQVERWSGDSRYSTAARISRETYPQGADTVFLASGVNFADALAGGPAAAKLGAPLLLTLPGCVPSATLAEIKRLGADSIVVLGGTAAVSEAAARLSAC